MSSEVGGIGGPPGQIPGGIGPIEGDQENVQVNDQEVLDEINILPDGEISITVDQVDIPADTEIPRDPHQIGGDEELLQQMNNDLSGSIGTSSAVGAIASAIDASENNKDRIDLEISVAGNEHHVSLLEDEIQITIEEGTARIPLNLNDDDVQITIERQDQDVLTIQVDEEGQELIDEFKGFDKNAREDNPEGDLKPYLHSRLSAVIKLFEQWIQQHMGR